MQKLILAATLSGAALAVHAETPPPSGVVNITATAAVEVARDLMSVTLGTTREGPDANAVQTALKQALDAALAEARKVAKPGQVDVQTGQFTLQPRYTNKGQASGWQGTAELLVEGRDMAAIAQLTGRISTLTIARVSQGLSRELREKTEGEVAAQAIARFRAKAADYAKAFGYSGYLIREVNVSSTEPPSGPVPMMRMQMKASAEDAALPVEAGKAPVLVSVSGTVQMMK
ncbi:MAG TPA: SIMPL domain-containing protein [Albitalea sp.]|uniref:SIMPL domain-containing protein n=1 Tax=Piscinibacter sp. TaxID=1903157 RepID=UPI002ED02524